jgi:hypothetical protein
MVYEFVTVGGVAVVAVVAVDQVWIGRPFDFMSRRVCDGSDKGKVR